MSALMGEIDIRRASSDETPANETEKVPLLPGRILKVAIRPSEVPTKKSIEE